MGSYIDLRESPRYEVVPRGEIPKVYIKSYMRPCPNGGGKAKRMPRKQLVAGPDKKYTIKDKHRLMVRRVTIEQIWASIYEGVDILGSRPPPEAKSRG